MEEKFFGFYTARSFWVGDAQSVQKRLAEAQDGSNESNIGLTELMIQEALTYETDDYVLKVCKDGMFLFKLKQGFRAPDKNRDAYDRQLTYLDYLNCIYLLFQTAVLQLPDIQYLEVSEVTDKDVFLVKFEADKFLGCFAPRLSFAHRFQTVQLSPDYRYADNLETPRLELPESIFSALNTNLAVVCKEYRSIKTLSEITKGLCECKFGNYANCLLSLWMLIESYLSGFWSSLIESKNTVFEDGSKRIKSERMKHLRDGRVYSASVVSNILELFDLLDLETFRKIEKVRDLRNQIIHRDEKAPCKLEHCQTAFEIVREFVAQETEVSLNFDLTSLLLDPIHSPTPN
ncbi:hypothetical protein [Leptolyngbya sp. FACHB-261]|uniref:hypothetical protein n=1 Tax=Leptolyngbya sp. FACHB-261 TaxID=2692806 RepID=UPI001685B7D6|nr:hypothetical protein [Leptolyngbya sp. FACHB-261]MBD2105052.1 hypothetical protein [Leptolyngbya sp. FACHB-261]